MTQVWIVRYDQGLYVFKDLDTLEASIIDAFKIGYEEFMNPNLGNYLIEREEVSDQSVSFAVMQDGRIQDRIFANAFDVHEHPTSLAHVLFPDDKPPAQRVRKEF